MKKILIITTIIFSLSACAVAGGSNVDAEKEERFTEHDDYLIITTDKVTGCKYLIYDDFHSSNGGITPLMNATGTQVCN